MDYTRVLFIVFLFWTVQAISQEKGAPLTGDAAGDEPVQTDFVFPRSAIVTFSAITHDMHPALMVREMPSQSAKPTGSIYPANNGKRSGNNAVTLPQPIIGQSFFGNTWGYSTPNDNDFAISDSGMAISVINTNMLVRNTKNNATFSKSLSAFTTPVNSYHREFDPKVIYDPKRDRFAMVVMVGSEDSTSKIVVGFTKTNDPGGLWNLYVLPGNPLNNSLWSDYPMIAMSEKELFLTVNLLYNDSTWQKGFVQTLVWQMKKDSGYAGLPLGSKLHSNIKYYGKFIRNLCPVKGGSKFYGPHMYMLSNRNLDNSNDSVFIFKISDTIGASNLSISRQAAKASIPYIFPPDGRQPISTQSLATNDCRNLGAFYENGIIQYVHNTRNPANNRCSIYYGVITSPGTFTPSVTGYILDNDTMDFGYPNISYAGVYPSDNTALITFNHSSDKVFPGVSVVQANGAGDFSPVLRIKDGINYVNLLQSNLERWGDYSGSQTRYCNPGEVWMSGYYGYYFNSSYPKAHGAWITQLTTEDRLYLSAPKAQKTVVPDPVVYPVPTRDVFNIDISLTTPEYLSINLLDVTGKLVTPLFRDLVTATESTLTFGAGELPAGVYFINVTGTKGTSLNKKILIE
jgi:hypothetical protein